MYWKMLKRYLFKQFLLRPFRTLLLMVLGILFFMMFISGTKINLSSRGNLIGKTEERTERDSNIPKPKKIKTFLFLMVLTAPKSTDRRNAVRETWITPYVAMKSYFTSRFIVGGKSLSREQRETIKEENNRYGDILILEDLEDGYSRLTNKVLESFKWIHTNVDCSFVFKADDDSFVRMDLIINELKSITQTNLYWGFFRGNANVKKRGPWAEKQWVLCDRYLPYANGGGYVLSAGLVWFAARNWDLLQLYNSEDVSVGSWLAPVKVHRVHDTRFNTEYRSRGCNNAHIVSHKQSIQDMKDKYESLSETGNLCQEEIEKRKSFEYKWDVPPSQCCQRKWGIP